MAKKSSDSNVGGILVGVGIAAVVLYLLKNMKPGAGGLLPTGGTGGEAAALAAESNPQLQTIGMTAAEQANPGATTGNVEAGGTHPFTITAINW